MAKNEDGYIDFAIDDANKENQNVGNAGHGNENFHRDMIDSFLSHLSLLLWPNGPSKVKQNHHFTPLATVSYKGGMKTSRLGNGSVKLFSFTVMDASCDLKITAFTEDADK